MDNMTHDTEDTMISHTGLTMMTHTETIIIISPRILQGMHLNFFHILGVKVCCGFSKCPLCFSIGKKDMMTSGDTILVMTPALMMKTVALTCTGKTLIAVASTASSRHTACAAPTATTAGGAALARAHNRWRICTAHWIGYFIFICGS